MSVLDTSSKVLKPANMVHIALGNYNVFTNGMQCVCNRCSRHSLTSLLTPVLLAGPTQQRGAVSVTAVACWPDTQPGCICGCLPSLEFEASAVRVGKQRHGGRKYADCACGGSSVCGRWAGRGVSNVACDTINGHHSAWI